MGGRYDLAIVGGGIHGVGVAQAAAAGGYSVILLEREGLASGTSSRTSKLIHGGLRYLENGQLSLVRECLREREILLHIAPELVRLKPFYFPVYSDSRRSEWEVGAGLGIYSILSGLGAASRFKRVGKESWDALDGLSTSGLKAVYRYHDAQTDDLLLTKAVMRSAMELGAELAMPALFASAELVDDGCRVNYVQDGRENTCHAKVLVNAAGPWVNTVLDGILPGQAKAQVDLVQGAHIVMEGSLSSGIFYVEAPSDGRVVLVMPWKGATLVGTTETPFSGDPSRVEPMPEELAYLSSVLTHYFPRYTKAAESGPVSSFAGIRVLPEGRGTFFRRLRETLLRTDREKMPRLVSIYGGKLTAYRATAEKVMGRIASSLPVKRRSLDTAVLPLSPE